MVVSVAGPTAFQCLQKLINQLNLFVAGFQLFVPVQALCGGRGVIQTVIDQGEVVINERKVRLDLRGGFVMQTRKRKVAGIVIEICQIVVCLNVARIVFQRLSEVLERANCVTSIQFDNSLIAECFRHIVAFINCFDVKLCRLCIALLVQQQGFFKRR